MGETSDFEIGQTVELQDGRLATVQYIGDTHFAPGDWIGVVLSDASGKNDGAVQGQRYFDCEVGHGMFVRPGVAAIINQPPPVPAKKPNGVANGAAVKARPSTMIAPRRQSILDPGMVKRQSINAGSPTPSARTSTTPRMLRSPSKSPTKQLTSRPTSVSAISRTPSVSSATKPLTTTTRPRVSISGRPSMGPPTSTTMARGSRQSMTGPASLGIASTTRPAMIPPTRRTGNRLSTLQQGPKLSRPSSGSSQASGQSGLLSPGDSSGNDLVSPSLSDVQDEDSRLASGRTLSNISTAKPTSQRAPASTMALGREIEDLKTKLRLMEKKRMEDRDKLKALEKVQGERDKFESIIKKLQAKYQPQQQEIAELKRLIKESEAKLELSENQQIDVDTTVEMATLDREMAEETAEALKNELDILRQRHEELELEVDILREENSELGKEMSPEERTSQGWMQMERSNERLREALLRLRDMTQEQEAELKDEIKELEKDVQELGGFRAQYDETKGKLEQSDSVIEDLRQQLEAALGAEEMIEELTEKNMSLTEQMDDLRVTIEDLESLKELNDELEINHIETEKQMQDELDYQEVIAAEQARKAAVQEDTIDDLEYTVTRFRELVTNLQSDLEDMRASQQITESEANELTSRSRAMLDLNMRLQVSASKAQVKAIDLELGRLEAQESAEHLAIVQMFLPQSYKNDRDSVNALLRFKRIHFKSNLLHGFIKERVNGVAVPGHEDDIFICCEILDKLTWVSAMCDRFVKFIRSCSLEAFQKLDGALYDLEPVERALNGWIEGLKRDELKEKQCAAELHRSIALITHLAERHISEGLQAFADDVHMRALLMQSNLENAAAALLHIKSITQTKVPLPSDADEEAEEEAQRFLQKADASMAQIRSAKVISAKAIRQLEELEVRSLTLDPSSFASIEKTQDSTLDLVTSTRSSGLSLVKLINEEGRTDSFTYDEIIHAISSGDASPFSTLSSKIQTATTQIQTFSNLTTTLAQTTEIPSPAPPTPWEVLSQKLHAETNTTASHEKDISRLKDELSEKNTALAMKDKIVEEISVNVEVLEKRVAESGGRREKLRELESALEGSRSKEKDLLRKTALLEQSLQTVQAERESWKKQAATPGFGSPSSSHPGNNSTQPIPAIAQADISNLKSEISILHTTIRHLRSPHPASPTSSLPPLPTLPPASSKQLHLAHEAQDALKCMLALITHPDNGVVKLQPRASEQRLAWRPVRLSPLWQLGRQREEWAGWVEWRDDVCRRGGELGREGVRRGVVAGGGGGKEMERGMERVRVRKKEEERIRGGGVRVWGSELDDGLGVGG